MVFEPTWRQIFEKYDQTNTNPSYHQEMGKRQLLTNCFSNENETNHQHFMRALVTIMNNAHLII